MKVCGFLKVPVKVYGLPGWVRSYFKMLTKMSWETYWPTRKKMSSAKTKCQSKKQNDMADISRNGLAWVRDYIKISFIKKRSSLGQELYQDFLYQEMV